MGTRSRISPETVDRAEVSEIVSRRLSAIGRHEILEFLKTHRWFNDLGPEDLKLIAGISVPRRYGAGALVHGKDEPSAALYGILSGGVRASSTSLEGRESVYSYMGVDDWFGHISLIDGLPRTHDAKAIQDSTILCIRHAELKPLLETKPILYKHFALKLCEMLRSSFELIDDNVLLPFEARLAKRLANFAHMYGRRVATGTLIDIHLPQHELASVLGVARQTVNRKMAEWQAIGWIDIHYSQIIVCDAEALSRLAHG